MRTLIIYDDLGFVISMVTSTPDSREPIGVPYMWVEIPQGKMLKITDGVVVDTTVTPHAVEFEDIPKTETELLQEKIQKQEEALIELAELIAEVLE